MTLSAGTVSLGVKADTSGFGEQLSSGVMGSSGVSGLGAKLGGMVVAGFAAVGVGKAIGGIFRTGFDEAKDASAGIAQLTAGITSTGNAANVSVAGMTDLAASIQGMSGQTDDSIVKAEQLLLTFTNIKNVGPDKIFDDATRAAADMAAKFGGDASSQAVLLGKALNDPVKGVTALTRVGVSFTQAQKDSIAAMVAAGDTMGAQKLILGELNTEFGGAAEAAGNSLPGQLAKTKRAFEDISQSLVEGFLPLLTPLLGGVAAALQAAGPSVAAFSTWMGTNIPAALTRVHDGITGVYDLLVKNDFTHALRMAFHVEEDSPFVIFLLNVRRTVIDVAAAFAPALATMGAAFGPLIPQLLKLWQSFSPLSIIFHAILPLLPQLATVFGQLATTIGLTLGSALTALMPAVTQVSSVMVSLLGTALKTILPIIVQVVGMLGPIFTTVINALVPIITLVAGLFSQLVAAVMPLLSPILALIAPLVQLVGAILGPLVQVLTAVLTPILQLAGVILSLLIPVLQFVISVLAAVVGSIVWVVTQTTFFQDAWKVMVAVVSTVWNWLWTNAIKPVVDFIVGYFTVLAQAAMWLWTNGIQPVAAWIGGAVHAIGDVVGAVFGAIGGVIRGAFDGVVGFVRGIFNSITGLVNGIIDGINGITSAASAVGVNVPRLGHLPMLADGGVITGAGSVIVGERGPELLTLPKGATVNPDISSRGGQTINIGKIETRDEDARVVARKFAYEWRMAGA